MKVYILTRGRADRQITLHNFSEAVRKQTTLVIHEDDGPPDVPKGFASIKPYPRKLKFLGDVRQWVIDNHNGDSHIVLIDDDFQFLVRKPEEPTHFRTATPADTTPMFKRIDTLLKKYAQVGLVARQAQHLNPEYLIVENTRIAGVLGFNWDVLCKLKIKFNRLPTMTDFDACLQLLRAGQNNAMICDYAYGQQGSNTSGGCSIYRTLEVQKQGAEGLKRLHPDFVKLTERATKASWGGGVRTDVTVYWRKAAASALSYR